MKKVKMKRPITHQGKQYKPGDVMETTEEHAMDLIKQGHAEEHEETIGSQHPSGGQGSGGGGQQGGPPSGKPPGGSGGTGH